MNDTITDADIRIQIEKYLAAGESPQDFDVEGILDDVMEIVRDRNLTGIDGIDGEVLSRILHRWDRSGPITEALTATPAAADPSPTQSLLRDIYAAAEFITTLTTVLPVGTRPALSTHVELPTREALNEMAERFDRPAPEASRHYAGAQFSVPVPGSNAFSTVLFFWVDK
jgi:hypothetical protein